jgi:endogenous inhibitor of DNA gyrase (YacG/DUF329 family)
MGTNKTRKELPVKVCSVCLKEKQVDSKHHPAGACSQRCADKQLQRKAIANLGDTHELRTGLYSSRLSHLHPGIRR